MIVLGFIAMAILRVMLAGWGLMLAVGVAHAEWVPNLPTIGFGPAMLIAVLLSWMFIDTNVKSD